MNKTAIKNFAVWARQKLISDITYKAGMLGITEDGIADKLPHSTSDLEFYDIGTKDYAEVSGKEIKQRNALVNAIRKKEKDNGDYKSAFGYVVEEVAYTWFNRLIAIRFMEVNDYLPSGVRVLSSENKAKKEPDLVTTPFDTDLEFTSYEQDRIIQLKDDNKLDELFRMLFIKQCNKLHDVLPELFEKTDDYTELLLTVSFTDSDGVLYHLVHDIEEDDFNVEKEGQVQIIGWLYQYYISEKHSSVIDIKGGKAIKKEDVPAATQLFTTHWVVQYMVDNSLGRYWIERNPESDLKSKLKFYVEPENFTTIDEKISPEDLTVFDPCMGSGHILVYAFEVLMQIYLECGYTERDATSLILENNLFGLDIDDRAYQLAYFAVMMKARSYDRRILTRNIKPNVYSIKESNFLVDSWQKISDDEKFREIFKTVVDTFIDAKEYGSILNVSDADYDYALSVIDNFEQSVPVDFEAQILRGKTDDIRALVNQAKLLSQKYDVVVTNPPYMAVSNAGVKVNDYVKKNFPDSKADMFAVFIERCGQMAKQNGYQAMITQHSWMFLSSFEKLRTKLLTVDIINMAHLGARAFDEIGGEVVQTTSFVIRKSHVVDYKGEYCRLTEPTSQQGKEDMFLAGSNRYSANQAAFNDIPGAPVVYWASSVMLGLYHNSEMLGRSVQTKQGLKSSDDKRFFRYWVEVDYNKIDFCAKSVEQAAASAMKWFPLNKGGTQKWYGDNWYVINWENDGEEIKGYAKSLYKSVTRTITSIDFYFRKCITWPQITSSPRFRSISEGFIFNAAGPSMFAPEHIYWYLLGFLNTPIVQEATSMLNPTVNLCVTDMLNVPFIVSNRYFNVVTDYVSEAYKAARTDWDSYETSWDFKRNPLI